MAKKRYRPWNPDQMVVFPPAMKDALDEGHIVFRIMDVVGTLDISCITKRMEEKQARGTRPYHPRMMLALLMYAYCSGVYSSRKIATATYDVIPFRVLTGDQHPHFTVINEFRLLHLESFVDLFVQVLELCGKGNQAHEISEELRRRQSRLERIAKAKTELEAEAKAAREQELRERVDRLRKAAEAVTNQAPDQEHLIPMIERARRNLGRFPTRLSADTGYMSEDNANHCKENGVDAYIAVKRDNHGKRDKKEEPPEEREEWREMRQKLLTEEGQKIYSRRKVIVEPVFGHAKQARGFRRFSLRGIGKASAEWTLVCLCGNLLKFVNWRPDSNHEVPQPV